MQLTAHVAFSQGYKIRYTPQSKGDEKITLPLVSNKFYTDSLSVNKAIHQQVNELLYEGYLQAQILKIEKRDSVFHVLLSVGDQFEWAYLKKGNIPEILLSKSGFRERFFVDKPFRYTELKDLFERVLKISENNGYPFSSIGVDSVFLGNNKVHAVLNYASGPLIRYDSLIIHGKVTVKRQWLAGYLRLNYNSLFDQRTINNIQAKIEKLNFVALESPPSVSFQNSQATVQINVKPVKSNRIDGIIGFLPNAKNDGSILVTGQLDLALHNLFNSGKRLNVQWQRLKPLSQLLDLSYEHPNIFNSPINIKLSFDLLKEDSLYINRNGAIAINYGFKRNEVSFFTDFRSSRLLSTTSFENQNKLPDASDFNLNYYGISYSFQNYSLTRLKRSGQAISGEIAAGNKRIRKNAALPPGLYEGIDLNSQQFRLRGSFEYYFHINKNLIFNHILSGGKIINDNLYLNDFFRLGGLSTLRGFNENFFFASDFGLSNLELQLYYSNDSYLFLFYDQSYIYYSIGQSFFEDYPLGIGLGVNMATKGGILSLAYALGYSNDQPLSIRLSKFHFGYIAKF